MLDLNDLIRNNNQESYVQTKSSISMVLAYSYHHHTIHHHHNVLVYGDPNLILLLDTFPLNNTHGAWLLYISFTIFK